MTDEQPLSDVEKWITRRIAELLIERNKVIEAEFINGTSDNPNRPKGIISNDRLDKN